MSQTTQDLQNAIDSDLLIQRDEIIETAKDRIVTEQVKQRADALYNALNRAKDLRAQLAEIDAAVGLATGDIPDYTKLLALLPSASNVYSAGGAWVWKNA